MGDPLDEHIKSKLNQHAPTASTEGAWDRFEHYLHSKNAGEASDMAMQDTIRHNVTRHTVHYNEQHWSKLENHLRVLENRLNHIGFAKIIELTAAMLIYILFIRYPETVLPIQNQNQAQQEIQQYTFQAEKDTYLNQELISESKMNVTASHPKVPVPLSDKQHHTVKTIIENPGISEDPITASNDRPLAVHNQSINNDLSASNLYIDASALIENRNENIQPTPTVEETASTAGVPAISLNELATEMARIISLQTIKINTKPEIFLSAYVSADAVLINTPFDKVYSKASYYKEAINRSAGINLTKRVSTFEASIGLAYAERKYNPEVIEEIYGVRENRYSHVTFNSISYDILSVPVQANYRFIHKKSWGAYIMASAVANVVVNAGYGIKDVVVLGRPSVEINRSSNESRLEEKPFIRGLFHGDHIRDDYFISAGFGFGLEKNIFKDASLYFQSSYQRHILNKDIGIGPNKDKLHTTSLQVGVKVKLS